MTCSYPTCDRPIKTRGWCGKHYQRWRNHGDPSATLVPNLIQGTLAERFWPKVDRNGPTPPHRPELGPCWLWTAGTNNLGRPVFGVGKEKQYAYRVAWLLAHGTVPKLPQMVLHHCDTMLCVKAEADEAGLAHLYEGTNARNQLDRSERQPESYPRGEMTRAAILRERDIPIIRARIANGESHKGLALEYGVSKTSIAGVVHRTTWGHVP